MGHQIDFHAANVRIQLLLAELNSVSEPKLRENTEEIVRLVNEIYGAALSRIVRIVKHHQDANNIIDSFCADGLLAGILALHNLHPRSVENRITQALETARSEFGFYTGAIELIKVDNGVAYLRHGGSCYSHAFFGSAFQDILERAIEEAAPEIERIQIDKGGFVDLSRGENTNDNAAPLAPLQGGFRCELCGSAVAGHHRHIAAIDTRKLLCACRACSFLFENNSDTPVKYRTIPLRYLNLAESMLTADQWDALEIPIGTAFFFFNSALHRIVACYPGPAGATESLLPMESWNKIIHAHPVLETLAADVEALLVDNLREKKSPVCYVLPIDACYEFVARLRSHWKGFDGGDEARREIDAFFSELRSRSKVWMA